MATDYRRFARWSARSTYRRCIQSLVVFERSTQTWSVCDRRRLRHRREGVGAGLYADVGGGDVAWSRRRFATPRPLEVSVTSGPLQRGTATDPLGPSLRSGPDRGLLSPMLDGLVIDRRGWRSGPARSVALWCSCGPEDVSSACGLARSPSGHFASAWSEFPIECSGLCSMTEQKNALRLLCMNAYIRILLVHEAQTNAAPLAHPRYLRCV